MNTSLNTAVKPPRRFFNAIVNKTDQKFIAAVWAYYHESGRHTLPWRTITNPYRILVSEIMLQQTQVDRVIPKYRAFLKLFPNVQALAAAPLRDVLIAWQGLGYNRRAKALQSAAREVVERYGGQFPRTYDALLTLPGVGPYTAGAVLAFAFNTPVPIIETNIRSVYIHHYFKDSSGVPDGEIMKIVERTLDRDNVRLWYYALMDYGVYLKKTVGNPNTRARIYTKQSTFVGSDRQIRGAIIKLLTTEHKGITQTELFNRLGEYESVRIGVQLERLIKDGLVVNNRRRYSLPISNQ